MPTLPLNLKAANPSPQYEFVGPLRFFLLTHNLKMLILLLFLIHQCISFGYCYTLQRKQLFSYIS